MIYTCADDYGILDSMSANIQQCIDNGVLNEVGIFPNFGSIDFQKIREKTNVRVSLHLNLVEGKCVAPPEKLHLLADSNGNLKHTFGGLFLLNLFHPKKLKNELYQEIRAQVLYWKNILPKDEPVRINSHQHTHMIPVVFRTLLQVFRDENIAVATLRIPSEPLLPYLKTPSLYFTYSPVNLVKQWLLKLLWLVNKKQAKKYHIETSHFFGILFSGKMDWKRVNKILPKYVKLAEKDGKDIEILFHPGYLEKVGTEFKNKNIVFREFYLSKNRKTEFDSLMKLSERGIQ